jgi:hypothetical protein
MRMRQSSGLGSINDSSIHLNQNRFRPISGSSCADIGRIRQVRTFIGYLIVRPQQKFRFFSETTSPNALFKVAFS